MARPDVDARLSGVIGGVGALASPFSTDTTDTTGKIGRNGKLGATGEGGLELVSVLENHSSPMVVPVIPRHRREGSLASYGISTV
jgi:hypothetical protein